MRINLIRFARLSTLPKNALFGNSRTFTTTGAAFPVYRFPPQTINESLMPDTLKTKVAQPVVIVLQEWWGIDDQIKAHAQKVADATGAVAVVPDIYNGKLGANVEESAHLMSNLDWDEALSNLERLVQQLRDEEFKERKIASLGFCMGGALSLALAAKLGQLQKPLNAAVSFYGTPSKSFIDISQIPLHTPVQAHFGQEDSFKGFSDSELALDLERVWMDTLQLNGGTRFPGAFRPEAHVFVYPKVGHAFMNNIEMQRRINPQALYQAHLVKSVWDRVGKFLRDKLYTTEIEV